ncbi:MAG TPA: glycerophosphodiester phosphodiesterase, partial [Gemmatimonadaceae bacterium]|nr:glycerophosphodiester phosphodiesterase [Gemmatimonadaceae bacterium]
MAPLPLQPAEEHLTESRLASLAISHRGAHDTLPENSIPAFERAIQLGADAIELDVRATSDGIVVVHHDPVLNAGDVPRGQIRISALSAQQLRKHQLAPGITIPTLTEALEEIGTRAMVFVEIKAAAIEPLVVRCIRESPADCSVHSFDHRIVRSVKQIFPAIRCGVLQVARHLDPLASLAAVGADDLWQHVDYIDEELVTRAHAE